MIDNKLKNIPERIGYSFKNPNLLTQAFTRRTYAMEHPGRMHNEILEFIGDKSLDLIVINELIDFYSYINENGEFVCKLTEGNLTDIKKRLVDEEMLSHRIDVLGFADLLIMGNGDVTNKVQERSAVKCDLFESIIGAVTIDSNWDFAAIKRVVDKMLDVNYYLINGEVIEDNNYIGLLQEWYQKKFKEYPDYVCKEVNDKNNKKSFVCELKIPGYKKVFQASAENKQNAKSKVAEKALAAINKDAKAETKVQETKPKKQPKQKTQPKEKKIVLEQPKPQYTLENAISQLNEKAQKKEIEKVEYTYSSSKEKGVLYWTCKASVKGISGTFNGKAKGKMDAKKESALNLIKALTKKK